MERVQVGQTLQRESSAEKRLIQQGYLLGFHKPLYRQDIAKDWAPAKAHSTSISPQYPCSQKPGNGSIGILKKVNQ